jgi:hypothetical protein
MALEEYAGQCVSAIFEERSYNPEHSSEPSGLPVLPPYPSNTDWQALGPDLMTAALGFRVHVTRGHGEVGASWDNDDKWSAWATATTEATILGHEALSIAQRLRAKFKVPSDDNNADFDPHAFFVEELNKLEFRRTQMAAQKREMWFELQADGTSKPVPLEPKKPL